MPAVTPSHLTVEYHYQQVFGPRAEQAGVRLWLNSGTAFQVHAPSSWPAGDYDRHELYDAIVRGIRDGLAESEQNSDAICVSIVGLFFHQIDFSPIAFYTAAKRAMKSLA